MGLIQREIERAGIPTVSISIVRELTEKVKPPRSIFLRWPFGHPLGEPFNRAQHRVVLAEAFKALYSIDKPGAIMDVPFQWKRHEYEEPAAQSLRVIFCRPVEQPSEQMSKHAP